MSRTSTLPSDLVVVSLVLILPGAVLKDEDNTDRETVLEIPIEVRMPL